MVENVTNAIGQSFKFVKTRNISYTLARAKTLKSLLALGWCLPTEGTSNKFDDHEDYCTENTSYEYLLGNLFQVCMLRVKRTQGGPSCTVRALLCKCLCDMYF